MRFSCGEFKDGSDPRILRETIYDKIEKTITLSREEFNKAIINKEETGICSLQYDGNRREGLILGIGSNGSYKIALLGETY